ncbi:hypothetical protein LTR37_007779 [Vermiconidia calcicola]|uniref:Uncharacterized protein n=1 Tax=Vermiconidia calcicola TaxID=1690605 RepID=A0ACC3NE85_9PEZI|nr:hypothetical protein LTR37_007779 [Vermiconidia calcicola]
MWRQLAPFIPNTSLFPAASNADTKFDTPVYTTLYLIASPQAHGSESIVLTSLPYNVASMVELGSGSDAFALVAVHDMITNKAAAIHIMGLRDLDLKASKYNITIFKLVDFPSRAPGLSGSCLLTPNTMLVADAATACIWRVDSDCEGSGPEVRKWLAHDLLRVPRGANRELRVGLEYNDRDCHVYFTSPGSQLLARVKVDETMLSPASDVEVVAKGLHGACALLLAAQNEYLYAASNEKKVLERISIPRDMGQKLGQSKQALSLAGSVYPGLLAGAWCSTNEPGRAAYLAIRSQFLSNVMDRSSYANDYLRIVSEQEHNDNAVTRVLKVWL